MPKPGPKEEFDDLYSLIYEELRRLALSVLRHDRGAAISPTTLVHEAWLKLSKAPALASLSRVHFQNLAAQAMRRVLIDAFRRQGAAMHGGGIEHLPFEQALDPGIPLTGPVVEAIHAALDRLEKLGDRQQRQARVVEAHFFGGLTFAECGELLGISEETVRRDWRMARSWLQVELGKDLHLDKPNKKKRSGVNEDEEGGNDGDA